MNEIEIIDSDLESYRAAYPDDMRESDYWYFVDRYLRAYFKEQG